MAATLNFVVVSPTAIADNAIVAAVAGKRIYVVSFMLSASGGANNATWKTAATAISPVLVLGANGFVSGTGRRDTPLFATAPGEALNLALTAATVVGTQVAYFVSD